MKEKLVFKRSQEEIFLFLRSESSKMEGMLRTIWRPIHLINCTKCDEVEPNKSEKGKRGNELWLEEIYGMDVNINAVHKCEKHKKKFLAPYRVESFLLLMLRCFISPLFTYYIFIYKILPFLECTVCIYTRI